jgi:hypothetical protein
LLVFVIPRASKADLQSQPPTANFCYRNTDYDIFAAAHHALALEAGSVLQKPVADEYVLSAFA